MRKLIRLLATKRHLRQLRENYRTNNFSGHPEDILWDIENAEITVKRLKAKGEQA
ncbi:hypothetical protein [Arthrobacter sp. A2-55]|uniref:hypothetical protein n=1 Tax=Arthrobacter sp. A2-55 TaxID=2897337 RepID=UPI0021CD26F6|nr:hypothetical protein [Arthrobacter sp. A2-55]MCU6480502.1 hypothetical protein [Arthrobacter sp. A2-55]